MSTKYCLLALGALLFAVSSTYEIQGNYASQNSNHQLEAMRRKRWNQHKEKYNLSFSVSEDFTRYKTYLQNLEYIQLFNTQDRSFKLGENQFAHWTHEEYLIWLGQSHEVTKDDPLKNYHLPNVKDEITDKDWRADGKVTPVKNQLECGGCYSFAMNAVIESYYLIKDNQLYDLSEQDVIDCSLPYGNHGCDGGYYDSSLKFAQAEGISQEVDYPYQNKLEKCKKSSLDRSKFVFIKNYTQIRPYNEDEMAKVASNIGPLMVAIDASTKEFKFFKCGIFESYYCSRLRYNHAVTVVGLGSDPAPYWIIKNSWGTDWGLHGYVNMARNKNMCGIAMNVWYPGV